MNRLPAWTSSLPILLILVAPVSNNYSLRQLDVGQSGGVGESANYKTEGLLSGQAGPMAGTTYNGGLGFGFTQMSFVPAAPTLTNPSNYYNKLSLTINNSGNPSDALFAIAISTDNFATTQYVKADHSIGSSLTLSDYQTYAAWGGASGFLVLGLSPGTTYQAKVKAMHGSFTESGFGPSASASTVNPSLTFDIDVASTDTSTSPPYSLSLGTLLAGTVTTATDKIWFSLDSNAESGAAIYIAGQNSGLKSNDKSYTITSATADLASASQGFGLTAGSTFAGSPSPLSLNIASYSPSGDNVGLIPTTLTKLASSTGPITAGRGALAVKAKASTAAPAAADYQEILTLVATAAY